MKLKALAIGTLALILPLTACSGNGDDAATGSSASASASASASGEATAAPTVDRDPAGDLPTITFGDDGLPTMATIEADPPTEISVKTLTEGDGETVGDGAHVTVNYAGFLWSDGSQFDSSYGGEEASFTLAQVVPGWRYGLVGTKVGDRVQVVVPPEYGYGDNETEAIPAGSTLVFVIDIIDVLNINTDALNDATATDAAIPEGLTIEGEIGAEPTMTFADGAAAPTEVETIVLAEGTGAAVTDTDTLVYHVTGSDWGGESSTTWPDQFQQVSSGGGEQTVGTKVGSRILLVYPADEASGTGAQVLVLDLLAVIPAE
ncbi:FKBP-type peptidyl-prolyl cis-trans isomerase [Tessaracoccus bendigoensis DSM 12906]|uniref:Peptidyl-prolyl cis-trans isomerase n=1 Tax=Tessaracoccus bendigoensis DSM 12906 TaxID=1123357 RepID=A0A1M6HXE0_9ACTN|nr:FKBP-type peptidyl-prolyl cis-trans isomerase [Tessaracoccus bendigoensis]SHJ26855.1 FKBP-type peptidyl-prolyl cis-trans isomerase [Tessaracoccus bendigoensis DSM 12906]